MLRAALLHQVVSRGPIAVTVEQNTDDAAAEYAGKGFIPGLGLPFSDYLRAGGKTPNPQSPLVGRSATKAGHARSESFLEALLGHTQIISRAVRERKPEVFAHGPR